MEMEKRVEEIKEHFGGLIDEETAVLLAEYSLGVKSRKADVLGFERVSGFVVSKRHHSEKKYCRIDIRKNSETVSVFLWDEAYEIGVSDIFPGMRVEILCKKGEKSYHVSSADLISFKVVESEIRRVSEVEIGNGMCVRGYVAGIEGLRKTKDGNRMAVFTLSDRESFATLVLWDDKVEYADVIAPGDEVIVLNAYVNEYRGRMSIHAGKNSYVELRKMRL